MKTTIYTQAGKEAGTIDLPTTIFAAPWQPDLVHEVVVAMQANARANTAHTKDRSEVSGGGKKPFKQKGTGNARQGSIRSPLMPGGGVAFPPTPRDYSYAMPRKQKQAGLKSALSFLLSEGRLFVVDDMSMAANAKTKEVAQALDKMGVKKAVLIDGQENETVKRASRNLKSCRYYSVEGLNVYDLLKYNTAIISKESIAGIEKRCGVSGA